MLREIGTKDRIPLFLAKAKDKADPFKLMGFGHRVYRNFDPRARQMKTLARECIEECFRQHDAAERARVRGRRATCRSARCRPRARAHRPPSCANCSSWRPRWRPPRSRTITSHRASFSRSVDFYSGLALTAMGIPLSMFTVIFAIGRSVGWITQWKESIEEPCARSAGRDSSTLARRRAVHDL